MDTQDVTADRELKERHRGMWASGDYPAMVRDFLLPLGPRLVEAAGVRPGQRVLDVAAGTGNAAIAAARAGAQVVASDLTPELFEDGRRLAADAGVALDWQQADAEALPFEDEAFDVVLSCIGAMFAPRHEAVARELARVCRRGGTVAMLNWTPEGAVGALFRAMGPYMPAPPPGATPPPRWGDEAHLRELFGDALGDLRLERAELEVTFASSPAALRESFKARYGPTIVAYRNAGDADHELDSAIDAVFASVDRGPAEGPPSFAFEYLVVTGTRR